MASTTTNYGFDVPTSSDLVKNGATQIALLGQDLDTFLFRPFTRNVLINGGFDNFQRGTSSSTQGWTCADRWYNIIGGTTTFSQDTSVPTAIGVQYSYKWTTGASSSFGQFYTALESATVKPLRGQSMVFSFYVKTTGTAFSGVLNADATYSTSTDAYVSQTVAVTITGAQSITPTSTWTRYSGTVTIPSDAVGFKIGIVPTVVQASGVVVYLAACQLEVGSQATPFARAGGTIQGELAACQRYYYRVSTNTITGSAYALNSVEADAVISLPVTMRTTPTVLDSASVVFRNYASTTYSMSSMVLYSVLTNPQCAYIYGTISGATAGHVGTIQASYIGIGAEL